MTKLSLSEFKKETEAIYESYRARFAGMPRATRDPAELQGLVGRLEDALRAVESGEGGARNPALLSLVETAEENLTSYRQEVKEIRKATADPESVEAANLASRANRVFDVYSRHFAGQDRGTRDVRLLMELIEELEPIQDAMQILANGGLEAARGDLDTVTFQLNLYNDEISNIRAARATGTMDEQASRLANLANSQFKLYGAHFSGKSRLSRRAGLLQRMIENLEEYKAGMQAIASAGYKSDQNINNMDIIKSNLDLYRSEKAAILEARQPLGPEDVAGALGAAANETMGEYRENYAGKSRASMDLDRLGVLCDQLRDVYLQMFKFSTLVDMDFNAKNLVVVTEARGMYEAEWKEIRAAADQ